MSQARFYEPNAGPLKLEHDLSFSPVHADVKPRLYEGNRGVQYGSRHLHTPPPVPKRTYIPPSVRAVPFGENKTQEEIEKRMFLQKEVEQDIQRYKEEQAQKKQREMEEKRKDLERLKNNFMLDAHKYGHGASKGDGDHKRRKFQEEELTPRENPRYRDPKTKHPDFFLSELSKERAVEQPSHTDHTLRGDGIIRFQEEGRKSIENRFRYNKPQQEKEELRRDLDRQQIERQHREHAEKLRDLRQEVELLKSSDHYGKPGAGAPNKSSSVATMRDQVATMKRSQVYEPEEALYSPFGRPGCGAPMKDTEGRIVAVRQGKLRDTGSAEEIRKKRAALSYRRDLQHEMEEQKRNREDMENYMKAPIGELTEIMKEGLVGRPRRDPITGTLLNQHLANSDISKLKMNKSEVKPVNSMKEYHDFLTHQALERERTKRLDKLRDNQEWKHHHDVFGSMFGKRGGGAPKGDNLKKERLDNTLFSPRRDHKAFVGDQNEEYSSSKLGQRFVKSTIPSKHSNMYEIPEKGPSNPYSTRAPYAIHNY
ncbi:inner centromere protein A-like isoform X7 [Haliotis asinina]|uniref:inner centromere protein A-like isoform X7 n=1 Tax=Haliotis asinina TaxID=109174 RepID=UPI0035327ECA